MPTFGGGRTSAPIREVSFAEWDHLVHVNRNGTFYQMRRKTPFTAEFWPRTGQPRVSCSSMYCRMMERGAPPGYLARPAAALIYGRDYRHQRGVRCALRWGLARFTSSVGLGPCRTAGKKADRGDEAGTKDYGCDGVRSHLMDDPPERASSPTSVRCTPGQGDSMHDKEG